MLEALCFFHDELRSMRRRIDTRPSSLAANPGNQDSPMCSNARLTMLVRNRASPSRHLPRKNADGLGRPAALGSPGRLKKTAMHAVKTVLAAAWRYCGRGLPRNGSHSRVAQRVVKEAVGRPDLPFGLGDLRRVQVPEVGMGFCSNLRKKSRLGPCTEPDEFGYKCIHPFVCGHERHRHSCGDAPTNPLWQRHEVSSTGMQASLT